MLPFLEVIQSDLNSLNDTIVDQLYSEEPLVEDIGKHLINAGGKRLRPILVLLAAKSLNYAGQNHIKIAAIIEFIHTATLLHDDVVDVSELRRGLPTANSKWGNAPSVLVGDFLYSRAFQILVEIADLRIMNVLANTTNTIAEGEVQQLANAHNPNLVEADYLKVIYKKTAALFESACHCGALISTEDPEQTELFRLYGRNLGLAFQLMDDLLDYAGKTETLGKNVGDDLSEGKMTLPLIYTLSRCEEKDKTLIIEAIRESSPDSLKEVALLTEKHGGIDYTRTQAIHYAETAIQQLSSLAGSEWKESLIHLANFAVKRAY